MADTICLVSPVTDRALKFDRALRFDFTMRSGMCDWNTGSVSRRDLLPAAFPGGEAPRPFEQLADRADS